MKDEAKTKEELIKELTELRRQVATFKDSATIPERMDSTVSEKDKSAQAGQDLKFRSVIENSPTVIFIKDPDSSYLFINKR